METNNFPGQFAGSEIHGFRTMDDLDIPSIIREAKSRWLRPNEIHAILSNYTYFNIHVKPVNLPQSGTIVLFDRKMLRNFRKDGHNWKKKKDGKTVKEAHEHLKVGTEERIHVYYAHGQDNPNFVRRCYWLLDKALEHIVLVHYRQTQELHCSPVTPMNSNSGSELSDLSPSQLLSEETDSGAHSMYYMDMKQQLEPGHGLSLRSRELQLHEINTLDWDELLASNDLKDSSSPIGEGAPSFEQHNQHDMINLDSNGNNFSASNLQGQVLPVGTVDHVIQTCAPHSCNLGNTIFQQMGSNCNADDHNKVLATGIADDILDNVVKDGLQTQDSFGRWMNHVLTSTPDSVDNLALYPSLSTSQGSYTSQVMANQAVTLPQQIFCITEVSPSWAYPNEETKILVVGFFHEEYQHMAKSEMLCICGETCFPVEAVQVGVFRCLISPKGPGLVNFYLSMDGLKPISQVLTFEVRQPVYYNANVVEDESSWEEFSLQMRLAHLLFSSCKTLEILSGKVPANAHAEAKKFIRKTTNMANGWAYVIKLIENGKISSQQARNSLLEITLKNKLREWLLERIADGSKISERDSKGQGVLHLCAILGYTWAIYPFSLSTLSLDFRDKFGWTSLHWAAYFGREKMVAALLSAGAKPNLVTDPTSEKPGGYTAAELASKNGYDGLAAYLSEKALIQQFTDMTLAGNASGSLEIAPDSAVDTGNLNADEVYLKDTLTAYRTAADAAARIQAAFREQSFKLREKAVQFSSPEMEARNIIAAMKIQHAFRNYETRKQIAAAARIQYRFRTWKLRREFLYMRQQAIKLQSAFRAFQLRKQYRKILWSVGVLEKGVLRWRLKRKGLRGLQVETVQQAAELKQESDTEEEFFQAGRKQAEERVEKAVVCVQAMFRSRQAQLEYRRMKIAHNQAELEYAESAQF